MHTFIQRKQQSQKLDSVKCHDACIQEVNNDVPRLEQRDQKDQSSTVNTLLDPTGNVVDKDTNRVNEFRPDVSPGQASRIQDGNSMDPMCEDHDSRKGDPTFSMQ